MTMYSNGSKFNKLIITKPGSFYVAKNQNNTTGFLKDLCNELIEDYDDIEPPTKVTGLTVSEISATSIHIVWEQSSDNVRVTGYEVYRNGEKLVTTGRTEFIDGLLEPNTAYTYQVYAFDESRNYSAASDKINLKTLADTDSPETPHNVKSNQLLVHHLRCRGAPQRIMLALRAISYTAIMRKLQELRNANLSIVV